LSNLIEFIGKVSSSAARIVVDGLRLLFEGSQILTHIAEVGYKSLPLVAPAGFALGTVMTFHTRSTLVTFGASAMIPTVQAVTFFVEIAPLVDLPPGKGVLSLVRVGRTVGENQLQRRRGVGWLVLLREPEIFLFAHRESDLDRIDRRNGCNGVRRCRAHQIADLNLRIAGDAING
jgi:Permease MlaE